MSPVDKPGGERKQVTILFADVQGSMDLAEQQGPEQWHAIMRRFFATLADAVHDFEGTVDKFTGDGIMAVFGAPVAHEDHARRACYAALKMLDDVGEYAAELRRRHGLNFSTRIGINSGEVVAAEVGEGGYTAIGHTVGLAQRMEALAEPGKAYLTESTAEFAHGFMDLVDLGRFEIKGSSQPVGVFELAGVGPARSRLDLSRERGFSRFVGRDEEMSVLEAALARAEHSEGAAVGIVAEPGIGKSRLSHEFAERCRERGHEVFEAQAQAHGRSIPLMPVLQMLRAYFGIGERDPERLVREKIAGRSLLLDPELAEDLPLLFDFLGVPDPERPVGQMSPETRQRALARIVCRIINAPRRHHTVVLVVEDLHWIDDSSEAMLAEMLAALAGTMTLAVVNFRPEYTPSWGNDSIYRELKLKPLGPTDTRDLLRDLAGEDASLDGLEHPIHERTAGNPFFVEEIVRELVETGHFEGERGAYRLARPVEDAGVPATVQAVLAARIDRLGPDAKQLLQVAAVLGKEVGSRSLGMTAGLAEEELNRGLCDLVDGGFLYEAELYPDRVLAFRHPLTQEVAYGTQLAEGRAATHAAAARATIALEPDRLDELAALVANHLEVGGETREAARWSARAAYWAGSSQPREAMRLWQTVTRLAAELEEDDEATALAVTSRLLQLDFAWRLGMDSDEEARLAAEAEEIATRSGDLRSLALLRMATGARPGIPHQAETWIAAAEEANRLADESGDLHLRVAIRAAAAYALLCSGHFERFDRMLDEVLELAGDDGTTGAGVVIGNPVAWALMGKAMVRKEWGDLDRAEEMLEAALRMAGETDDPETTSWIRGTQAMLRSARGDLDGGVATARRNCELTERMGDVFSRTVARANLCATELAAGDFTGALATIEEADRLYLEAMGDGGEMAPWRGALRAQALLGVGRVDEAVAVAERASHIARERGMRWPLPLALQALGRALAAAGRHGAREAYDEAAVVAEQTGARMSLIEIDADRAELTAV